MIDPLPLLAYRGVARLVAPLAPHFLKRRAARGKEAPARMGERLGEASLARPDGPLVWLHAASVGELVSALPLVEALSPRVHVLVTSGTVASAELAAQRLPAAAAHQFVPLDTTGAVRRFIAHWRPGVGVFIESEIWPNLIRTARAAGCRLAIANGRMSERSFAQWSRFPRSARALLAAFDVCLAQTEEDAARYRRLGLAKTEASGNLKFEASPLPFDAAALSGLRAAVGRRPVFLAASTHPGEDEAAIAAHLAARRRHPDLLTIIAPRHAERGGDVAQIARAAGLTPARRSAGETITAEADIYVADTLGELGLFYRLAPLALVGGSIAPRGGHNPIEPAKLGVAILHGPRTENAAEIFARFDAEGGALMTEPDALGERVAALLADERRLAAMGKAAEATAASVSGALAKTLAALEPLLPASAPERK